MTDQSQPSGQASAAASAPQPTPRSALDLTVFATVLFVYGWVSVHIYLPALPQLEHVFAAESRLIKLTVPAFLLGYAFSQLAWGPFSDRFGRRPVLLTGLAMSTIGAALSALAPGIGVFIAARFLEALGVGVGTAVGRAVLTDLLDHRRIAHTMAHAVTFVAMVPALAAIAGGYLALWSWRAIFAVVAVYGLCALLLVYKTLSETIARRLTALRLGEIVRSDLAMLRHGRFAGFLVIYGISFGGMIGYYATAPYLFTQKLGFAPDQYGYLLLVNVIAYIAGVQLSRHLVQKHEVERPLILAISAYALSVMILLALDMLVGLDTLGVLLPMSIYVFGAGLISPAANAGAMSIFRDRAGAAAGFIGFSFTFGSAVMSAVLAHVDVRHLWQLAVYVGTIMVVSGAVFAVFLRKRQAEG